MVQVGKLPGGGRRSSFPGRLFARPDPHLPFAVIPPFTPTSLILESIDHDTPDCVFVSVTLDENLLSAKRMVEKINEKYGLPIIVGGSAVQNDSENWDLPLAKNLSIPKILKLIQSKKLQILTTA